MRWITKTLHLLLILCQILNPTVAPESESLDTLPQTYSHAMLKKKTFGMKSYSDILQN